MKLITVLLIIISLLTMGCSTNLKDETPITDVDSLESTPEVVNAAIEKVMLEDLSQYFKEYDGTFVLFDKNSGRYTIYNEPKSKKRVPPCSTFKIVNSLIGLETGVVKDENDVYQWDGKKRSIEEWNKDHTLTSAVRHSVVWYFQELARNIGAERMQTYLDKMDYGNKDISGGIDRFWLQSSLEISPEEQVDMLRKLYDYQLPFSKRSINTVKKIIIRSQEDGIIFSGKTGSGEKDGKGINGWFVGYVEKEGNVYFFATNIAAENHASGVKAKELTEHILKDKGIL
ncbi:class D beta-lactamase [Anaerosolibacter sp.]|uniref:class D beta-lactamase n=1 Tax=Anaerosolibacter sp. TaxID=1872527 RepID=UPI0039EF57F2